MTGRELHCFKTVSLTNGEAMVLLSFLPSLLLNMLLFVSKQGSSEAWRMWASAAGAFSLLISCGDTPLLLHSTR